MTHDELAEIDVFRAIGAHARRHDGCALVAIAIGSGDGVMQTATLMGYVERLSPITGTDQVTGIVHVDGPCVGGVDII